MSNVHPSAIVDPQAVLAPDVTVGPWCVILGPVTLGPRCVLHHNVTLKGPLTVGENNVFHPHVAIGYEPQDLKFDPARGDTGIVIGSHNVFREGFTAHRATHSRPTTIGDHNYFMVNSHVAHDCIVANHVTMVNGSLIAGHVELHDHCILGGGAVVHQFCRIGMLAMIGGAAGTLKDLPPFCVMHDPKSIGSINLVGMRRAGLRQHIDPIRKAFDILFRRGHTKQIALALIADQIPDDPMVNVFTKFVHESTRGIARYVPANRGTPSDNDSNV
ncbi:MAG: acyl-ACP--UDP-N-acetylglucosamine O-acyltransferase [Phycisphaerales bacterium]